MAKKKPKAKKNPIPKEFDPHVACKAMKDWGLEKFILIGKSNVPGGQIVLCEGYNRLEMVGQLELSKQVMIGEGLSNCRVTESEG